MSEPTHHLRVPADATNLKAIRRFLEPLLRPRFGEASGMLILAIDEACANIVRHRAPDIGEGRLELDVGLDDQRLRCRIACYCHPGDVSRIRPRDLEDVRPGGLGTHFINEIMDRVDFVTDGAAPDSMALVLEKRMPVTDGEG